MKKMMIMAFAIVATTIASASSVNWKLTTGATYSGMDVYGLTGTDAATVLAACQSTDATKWADAFSGFDSFEVTGSNARAAATGLTTGIAAGDNLVLVIVDGAVADGSKYWVVNDYTIQAANVFDPPSTGTAAGISLSTLGTAGSGTFTAVPEPTSGLLMLLGMAGLALRRRRA